MNPAEVSAFEGSVTPVRDRWMSEPSSTEAVALNVAEGATLDTSTLKEACPESPSLSVTFTVTG